MMKSIKNNPLIKILNNSLIKLPTPINISMWWNFGSILGLMLMIQIISGFMLTMHYCPNTNFAFESIIHIMKNINNGWIIRLIHMNGASFFFMSLYLHIGRGLYYMSYLNLKMVWITGILIFLISMMTAFMGYVLPWGQMSLWGATVITNLITTIPYMGEMIVKWIWGSFSIENPTLNRFFSFHFIMPFLIVILVIIHLMFIHEKGSNNPLGSNSNLYKIKFHPFFTLKDLIGFILLINSIFMLTFMNSYMFSDPENFIMANSMITPIHIQPEWYFLFAYTILRSIPNKLGGVIALLMSILILNILTLMKYKFKTTSFYPINQLYYWTFINMFILLTWLGKMPIKMPFLMMSKILTLNYFLFFFFNLILIKMWEIFIKNLK